MGAVLVGGLGAAPYTSTPFSSTTCVGASVMVVEEAAAAGLGAEAVVWVPLVHG